mgnify:CR=1 FL=1
MIEIISVKDIKDATPEELANLRRKGLLPEPGEHLEDLSARMSEPEHRWLLLETDGQWKTLLPRTAERG